MVNNATAHLESVALTGQLTPVVRPDFRQARYLWAEFLESEGRRVSRSGPPAFLTPPDGNAKLAKGRRPSWSLTLAPSDASGHNVCPNAGACRAACVLSDKAGRAVFDRRIMAARVLRTRFLVRYPAPALSLVAGELARATRDRRRIAVRLNAASDLRWELIAPDILAMPYVDPYDYTKLPPDLRRPEGRYRLIYSVDERDDAASVAAKAAAGPLAVVLDVPKHHPPAQWGPYPTIDGDADDYRNALAPAGTAVVLALKGTGAAKASARRSGFVQPFDGPREVVRSRLRLAARELGTVPCA